MHAGLAGSGLGGCSSCGFSTTTPGCTRLLLLIKQRPKTCASTTKGPVRVSWRHEREVLPCLMALLTAAGTWLAWASLTLAASVLSRLASFVLEQGAEPDSMGGDDGSLVIKEPPQPTVRHARKLPG